MAVQRAKRIGAIVAHVGAAGLEPERAVIAGQGFGIVALRVEHQAEVYQAPAKSPLLRSAVAIRRSAFAKSPR